MAYTLDEFCAERRALLKAERLPGALPQIAERLGRLLANPAFVAETFSDDMPPSAPNPKFAHPCGKGDCELRVQRGTRIIELLVVLRFRSSHPNVPQAVANFGIGPLARRVLHHDAETDFYVLAHVQEGNKIGKPHSHGSSWAIYGNAREYTEMTEWRRVNPAAEDHTVLEAASKYRLGPGQTKAYGPDVIHSTAHPRRAWVIRVTGTDLDVLPRYHFGKQDRILEQT